VIEPMFPAGPRDWAEDFSHENGQYANTCTTCREHFVGHKRRFTCKLCATPKPMSDVQSILGDKPESWWLKRADREGDADVSAGMPEAEGLREIREIVSGNQYWANNVKTDWLAHLLTAYNDARTEAVALRARIAALEAGPTDAQCDAIIDGLDDFSRLERFAGYGLPSTDEYGDEMRAIIRAALARPTPEGA